MQRTASTTATAEAAPRPRLAVAPSPSSCASANADDSTTTAAHHTNQRSRLHQRHRPAMACRIPVAAVTTLTPAVAFERRASVTVDEACDVLATLDHVLQFSATSNRRDYDDGRDVCAAQQEALAAACAIISELCLTATSATCRWVRAERAFFSLLSDRDLVRATEMAARPMAACSTKDMDVTDAYPTATVNDCAKIDVGFPVHAEPPVESTADQAIESHVEFQVESQLESEQGELEAELPSISGHEFERYVLQIIAAREAVADVATIAPSTYDLLRKQLASQAAMACDACLHNRGKDYVQQQPCARAQTHGSSRLDVVDRALGAVGLKRLPTLATGNCQAFAAVETTTQLSMARQVERESTWPFVLSSSTFASFSPSTLSTLQKMETAAMRIKHGVLASAELSLLTEYDAVTFLGHLMDANCALHDGNQDANVCEWLQYLDRYAKSESDATTVIPNAEWGCFGTLEELCKVLGRPLHLVSAYRNQDVAYRRWSPTSPNVYRVPVSSSSLASSSAFESEVKATIYLNSKREHFGTTACTWYSSLLQDIEASMKNDRVLAPMVIVLAHDHYMGVVVDVPAATAAAAAAAADPADQPEESEDDQGPAASHEANQAEPDQEIVQAKTPANHEALLQPVSAAQVVPSSERQKTTRIGPIVRGLSSHDERMRHSESTKPAESVRFILPEDPTVESTATTTTGKTATKSTLATATTTKTTPATTRAVGSERATPAVTVKTERASTASQQTAQLRPAEISSASRSPSLRASARPSAAATTTQRRGSASQEAHVARMRAAQTKREADKARR